MTERKKLSLVTIAGLGATALVVVTQFYSKERMTLANETSAMRSFVLKAEDIIKAKSRDRSEVTAGGLSFAFSGVTSSSGKLTIKGGDLYNVDLAGESANEQGRIGTGFKKVSFEGLENNAGFIVDFMSDESTVLETKTIEAGNAATEVLLNGSGNAKRVKMTFNAGTGVSFTSITYFYTCGSVA